MALTKVKLIADGTIVQSNLHASHGITTADIGENASYLYYTDGRVSSYLSSNGYATQTDIVAAITDSAPATLNTLNELAAALGDDANFSTTVTNSIATKLPLAGGTLTGKLTISQSGADMIDLTRTSVGTYRLAVSLGDAFSIYDVGAAADRFIIDTSGNASLPSGSLTVNSGTTNVVATFTSTDGIAGIALVDNSGNVELSASGNTFQVQPAGGAAALSVTSTSATFAGDIMPAAENAHNIGSAAVRWEDLYVDDGFIRNAYIDTNIYHNGDTDTYINFTDDTIKLATAGSFGFELDSNRDINSPDRLYMRQTYFGYSGSYKVVQFGNAVATSAISLGYNPSGNTDGGFSGNEILIPNNIRILAPNAANNSYYGLMILDSNNKLKLGSSNYLIESNYIMALDPATKNVGIGTDSPGTKLEIYGDTSSGGFGVYPALTIKNDNSSGYSAVHFNQSTNQKARIEVSNSAGTMGLYTTAAANGVLINSSGNVGIGTTSPTNGKFVINQNSSAASFGGNVCQLFENFNTTDGQMMSIGFRNNNSVGTTAYIDAVAYDQSIGATDIRFSTYSGSAWSSNMVTFQHTGRVGIGTTSPDKRLTVGGVNATEGINLKTKSGSNVWTIWSVEQYFSQEGYMRLFYDNVSKIQFRADGDSFFNGGNVGIATTSPDTKLDVHGTTGTKNTTTLNSNTSSVYETSLYFTAGVSATSNHYITTTSVFPPMASGGYILVEVAASGYGSAGSNGFVFKYIAGGYGGHYNIPASYHPTEIIADTHTGNCDVAIYYPNSTTIGITVTNNQPTYSITGVMRVKITTTYG
jgi:hypothetical protein